MRGTVQALAVAAISALSMLPQPAPAQTYPIDCAILLCLSGGWPASDPCIRAKAEFIRRITPWPIEPPLQIWRCPMGVGYSPRNDREPIDRPFDIGPDWQPPQQILPDYEVRVSGKPPDDRTKALKAMNFYLARAVGSGADIDLSGHAFDFVRSIRVWDVRTYSFRPQGRDGDCKERYEMNLGTYDSEGQFRWQRSKPAAAPAWLIPSRECANSSFLRGVGVEWRDYQGRHGHELVRY